MQSTRAPSARKTTASEAPRAARSRAERLAGAAVSAAAAAQAVTILLTWELWGPRWTPPTMPVIESLAYADFGAILLALAVLALFRPRLASPAFCVVYGLAALADQTRLQPEFVSLAVLMTAPLYGAMGRSVARWHLTSLWLWAGLHKVLSLGWSTEAADAIAGYLHLDALRLPIAVVLPAAEIALGVMSLFPSLWRYVRIGGAAVHLGIFLSLSPMFGNYNSAVWPWNIAVAIIAVCLFTATREAPVSTPVARAVAAALIVYPALFYVGVVDAYLSHNLYTSNTASAEVCQGTDACSEPFDTMAALNVPLPPEPRLYREWFELECAPGSRLVVTGIRTRITGEAGVEESTCPRT
jgi:hypothetical protein